MWKYFCILVLDIFIILAFVCIVELNDKIIVLEEKIELQDSITKELYYKTNVDNIYEPEDYGFNNDSLEVCGD